MTVTTAATAMTAATTATHAAKAVLFDRGDEGSSSLLLLEGRAASLVAAAALRRELRAESVALRRELRAPGLGPGQLSEVGGALGLGRASLAVQPLLQPDDFSFQLLLLFGAAKHGPRTAPRAVRAHLRLCDDCLAGL